ncbi:MAG: hydantoinase [Planctomycetes bacterium]|nr:hydantoinase [Planctomycetota bacterium]
MTRRPVKVGIDVGGTFTHAVAVDAVSRELLGKAVVPTSHRAPEGVARGVVESMLELLRTTGIDPQDVELIAHSTTQATNALLEGDVARVGVVGIVPGGLVGTLARRQVRVPPIELAPGKLLEPLTRTVAAAGHGGADDAALGAAIDELIRGGAEVVVASAAFGVDDASSEERVCALAEARGVLATSAAALSRLYGLRIRTRTAILNAAMLPKMLETANRTAEAVAQSGITAPLMVMRSDGGIMDVEAMRRRPILTMLSGPAAGVAAAVVFERIVDGVFVEVGGTSSDLSLIRGGRPALTTARVGPHRLFVRTLDVRTIGVAGGSMVRAADGRVTDVGPRSAHIAGLAYEAFAPEDARFDATLVQPLPGDPADYVALRSPGAAAPDHTLTPTGAATLLGQATGYGRGRDAPTRAAWSAATALLGGDAEQLARAVLDRAADRVDPVVDELARDYEVADPHELELVGGGGGAEAIVPHAAQRRGCPHRIANHHEVISAIGVALGMLQDTVERTVVAPTEQDFAAIRDEATAAVLRMGAAPDSVDVFVEVDRRSRRLRATARGTPELRIREEHREPPTEAALLASFAERCRVTAERVAVAGATGSYRVLTATVPARRLFGLLPGTATRAGVFDDEGVLRLDVRRAIVESVPAGAVDGRLGGFLDELASWGDAGALLPDVWLVAPRRIADYTGLVERDQLLAVARLDTRTLPADATVCLIGATKR